MTLPPGTMDWIPLLGNRPILDKYRHQMTPILVEYTILVECPILVRFGSMIRWGDDLYLLIYTFKSNYTHFSQA